MKTSLIKNIYPMIPALILSMAAHPASAQVDATAWTNVEGTTIWARLDGMEGNRVILNMRGREYRVPVSRLAPKSIDKLEKLTGRKIETPAAVEEPVVFHEPVFEEIPELEIPPSETVKKNTYRPSTSDELPSWEDRGDPNDSGYAAVLPKRSSISAGLSALLRGRYATAPSNAPSIIHTAFAAGNTLQTKPYKWGGGHARVNDNGYDCSGSVSYVLIRCGLLRSPLTSGAFTRYGSPGPGRWITIYARNGHVFMTICGLRIDTGGHAGRGESGPRWCSNKRSTAGFVMRHPPGL